MHVIYRKICHARYLYIKRNVKKVWGARYALGARYLSKNTVFQYLKGIIHAVNKISASVSNNKQAFNQSTTNFSPMDKLYTSH